MATQKLLPCAAKAHVDVLLIPRIQTKSIKQRDATAASRSSNGRAGDRFAGRQTTPAAAAAADIKSCSCAHALRFFLKRTESQNDGTTFSPIDKETMCMLYI